MKLVTLEDLDRWSADNPDTKTPNDQIQGREASPVENERKEGK